uniref:Uncharacterized protein n=1 Tax=Octopus bimaculoides TaxID=37653 RepID=A0A0L8HU65_OCTBM
MTTIFLQFQELPVPAATSSFFKWWLWGLAGDSDGDSRRATSENLCTSVAAAHSS